MSHFLDEVYRLPGRSTRAIIDLDAIAENVRLLRTNQGPEQSLMAVVKADGYGHGAVMTARAAIQAGADRLGVASVGEVAALREAGLTAPILVLGPIDPSEIHRAIQLNAQLTVGTRWYLDAVQSRAEALGTRVAVHIKVDTGMHRYGASAADALELIKAAVQHESSQLMGLCTHLATADDRRSPAAREQISAFAGLVSSARPFLPPGSVVHASNSAASIRALYPEGSYDRVGIALYGCRPSHGVDLLPGMRPALTLATRVARVHELKAGEAVSYGYTYRASATERVALLPIGYADGYPRLLSNRAWVAIDGKQCPVRGRVCMDQIVVGNVPETTREGSIGILGGPRAPAPSVEQIAEWAATINYEIVAGLSPRIPRYYLRGGKVVGTLVEGQLDER